MGNLITSFIDIMLHLDVYLDLIVQNYGVLTHLILFLIIFCETGLVVTPFLPGDSLVFAAGAFAASGRLNLAALWILLLSAAVIGDTVNYHIGKIFGRRLVNSRFIKQKYLDQTEAFYAKHGGKTIIIARFVPIVRTFAPFVAGIGAMPYGRFLNYNIIGGFIWITLFLAVGFFFGNLPFVRHNFSLVIMAIIAVSLLPAVVAWLRDRRSR